MIKTLRKWNGDFLERIFTADSYHEKDIIKNMKDAEKFQAKMYEQYEIVKVYGNGTDYIHLRCLTKINK